MGASGRAILAYAVNDASELKSYATGSPIDLTRYPAELAQIRKRGYAISKDELIEGAVAVAAPFFNGTGRVAGSIGVFGPSARLHAAQMEAYGLLLLQEAKVLSKALGHVPSDISSK